MLCIAPRGLPHQSTTTLGIQGYSNHWTLMIMPFSEWVGNNLYAIHPYSKLRISIGKKV